MLLHDFLTSEFLSSRHTENKHERIALATQAVENGKYRFTRAANLNTYGDDRARALYANVLMEMWHAGIDPAYHNQGHLKAFGFDQAAHRASLNYHAGEHFWWIINKDNDPASFRQWFLYFSPTERRTEETFDPFPRT